MGTDELEDATPPAQKMTLADLLDPQWARDIAWQFDVGTVLKKALRGWRLTLYSDKMCGTCLGVSPIWSVENGTEFIDELCRVADLGDRGGCGWETLP